MSDDNISPEGNSTSTVFSPTENDRRVFTTVAKITLKKVGQFGKHWAPVSAIDADYVYSVKSHVNIGRGINGYNGSFDSVEEANRFAQAVAYTPNPSTQGLCFTGQEVSKYWALLSNGSHCYIAHGPAGGKIVAWVDREKTATRPRHVEPNMVLSPIQSSAVAVLRGAGTPYVYHPGPDQYTVPASALHFEPDQPKIPGFMTFNPQPMLTEPLSITCVTDTQASPNELVNSNFEGSSTQNVPATQPFVLQKAWRFIAMSTTAPDNIPDIFYTNVYTTRFEANFYAGEGWLFFGRDPVLQCNVQPNFPAMGTYYADPAIFQNHYRHLNWLDENNMCFEAPLYLPNPFVVIKFWVEEVDALDGILYADLDAPEPAFENSTHEQSDTPSDFANGSSEEGAHAFPRDSLAEAHTAEAVPNVAFDLSLLDPALFQQNDVSTAASLANGSTDLGSAVNDPSVFQQNDTSTTADLANRSMDMGTNAINPLLNIPTPEGTYDASALADASRQSGTNATTPSSSDIPMSNPVDFVTPDSIQNEAYSPGKFPSREFQDAAYPPPPFSASFLEKEDYGSELSIYQDLHDEVEYYQAEGTDTEAFARLQQAMVDFASTATVEPGTHTYGQPNDQF